MFLRKETIQDGAMIRGVDSRPMSQLSIYKNSNNKSFVKISYQKLLLLIRCFLLLSTRKKNVGKHSKNPPKIIGAAMNLSIYLCTITNIV